MQTYFLHDCKTFRSVKLLKGRGMFTTVILSRNYRRKSSPVVVCHFDEFFLGSIHCDICTGGDHL